jgi:SulP family sulfate permease
LPIFAWLPRYTLGDLSADTVAGLIVAIMLVPQAMAYASLAGLPPEIGLYASILPPVLYAVFGSGKTLAVGPVAIASLLTASSLADVANGDTARYVTGAAVLALLSGAMLVAMGVMRLGVLVNFISHPVISGFTSAAAIVIALGQLKHALGVSVPPSENAFSLVAELLAATPDLNVVTLVIGLASILLLLGWRAYSADPLHRLGLPRGGADAVAKAGPLALVAAATGTVWLVNLDVSAGVAIVGAIPAGLPAPTVPSFDMALVRDLLPGAALIAVVGFLESASVAKALAARRRQRIDADQELVALGAANLGAGISGGFPVAGGFGRSMVNFNAGAVTPMAGVITAGFLVVATLLLTPLFEYLPRAALAAIVIVAVAGLIDVPAIRHAWRINRADVAALAATFVAVLWFGVELGIAMGIGLSLALHLWRTSRPHIAIVGRVGSSEHFRNVKRHHVQTLPHVLAVRIDESLVFTNANYLEMYLLNAIAEHPDVTDVVLIFSAVNFVDASALESLERLIDELRGSGVTLHLAEVKGPISDRLARVGFAARLGPGRVFLSTHDAMMTLAEGVHPDPLTRNKKAE